MIGFDEQRLLGAAAAHLGVATPLEPEFQPALRALLQGLREEAELSSVGAWRASARLMTALGQRAALREFEAETPGLREFDRSTPELDAPIVITGLSRAATSLLHNLLARAPGLWAPRLWELQAPVPPERIDERWIDRRIRATEATLEQLDESAPEFRRMHPLEATSPDACSWLLRPSFSTLAHAFHWYVPSYVAFMGEAELGPAYRDHRRWLRVLAWRHRHDDGHAGARVVLEDIWHLWHLDALLDAYPHARVIQVHCDPTEALPSLARSCWTLQRVDAKRPRSKDAIGQHCLELVDAGLRANASARERFGAARFIDVSAREIFEDPIAVVRALGRRLQFPITEQALRGANRYLLDHRFARRAPARLRLEDFGLAAPLIEKRFGEYRSSFIDPLLRERAPESRLARAAR
jgi:hypothetical protein